MRDRLLPVLDDPVPGRPALRFGAHALDQAQLAQAAGTVTGQLGDVRRVAVWAEPRIETAVAVVAALSAGVVAVPINPRSGPRELAHVVGDSAPEAVLAGPGADLPAALAGLPRIVVDRDATRDVVGAAPVEPDPDQPALVVYTSGTTGPPKGAVLPRRAIATNLDALAEAWAWTAADVVAHALPLFHVHGLVVGVLGPLRRGGAVRHLVRFTPGAVAEALREDATMVFGVPTMYRRLADAAEGDPGVADALRRARLLVSGSAALPAVEHQRLERICGQRIVERYGMTETLMNTAVRVDGDRRAGSVGPPLGGIAIRLVDDAGDALADDDPEAIGEIEVRGPNLFLGYLNRPEATAAALRDGWFRTGDLATRAADGALRIVGRRATDLIKSGGFKIGAGEVESALREHPAVDDAAVTGEADADLGERIVAWVVLRPGAGAGAAELEHHVASLLSPHKRPRTVRFVADLPRNELGKVQKTLLRG